MSTQVLHSAPQWSAVAREQFRAVGVAVRREATLLALGVIGLSVVALIVVFRERQSPGSNASLNLENEMMYPAIILAFLVPLSIWKYEEPSRRSYHWTMPIDRGAHTLTKSISGWAWFMVAMLAYLLWMLLVATVSGGNISGRAELWQWVLPFTAATVAYLLGSTLVLVTDHPWRWAAGIVIGFGLLTVMLQAAELHDLRAALLSVKDGRWGLNAALNGEIDVPRQIALRDGRTIMVDDGQANFSAWLGATLLWLGLGSAGVVAAAYRHQER